jgi:DNA polymerase-3 subunit delta'
MGPLDRRGVRAGARTVWDELLGQERVAAFLRRSIADGASSHAYLFVGPPGAGKKSAARALACALLCADGGCGICPACTRVKRGSHPDVRVVEPEGAATYMVEQVRDLIHDVNMSPIEAPVKVYILDRAEALGQQAANALLKTLEEPPEAVVLVLLATSYEAVIPTVSSRCRVVRFAPLAPSGGVVGRAVEFLGSSSRREARRRLLTVLRDLPVMDGRDVLEAVRELLGQVRAPLDEVKARQDAELKERLDFLGKTAGSAKPIEEKHKRELTAREREGVAEILSVTESWLRDCDAVVAGAPELVVNRDAADDLAAAASCVGDRALSRALSAVSEARRRITYNVSPQLAVEAMLFDIQEAIVCPRSWE